MEHESPEPASQEGDHEVVAKPPLDEYIADRKGEIEAQQVEQEALADRLEREVLTARVDTAVQTIELLRQHAIPGQRVDVFTASDDDPIGADVLDAIYGRLGIRGARAEAAAEELHADNGDQIGAEFRILAAPDLTISELQIDGRMAHGSYRTLHVERPRA